MQTDTRKEKELESRHTGAADKSLLTHIAEKVGLAARASTVFAEPVERDGVTVIPVARIAWGFGGGTGSGGNPDEKATGEGSGGGGGVGAVPVGYIEIKEGRARYHAIYSPIYTPSGLSRVILASGIAVTLILGAIRKLARP